MVAPRDIVAPLALFAVLLGLTSIWIYARTDPGFRGTALLGIATLGVFVLIALWFTGRTRWMLTHPGRLLGVVAFVGVGGYLIYDVWWM